MLIGSILIGVALLVLIFPFVFGPLQRSTKIPLYKPSPNESKRRSRRSDILHALRDLEFDQMTGKLADEDYQALRLELMKQAAESEPEEDLDAQIESAILAARNQKPHGATCEACGSTVHAHDRFCPSCGAPIAAQNVCHECGHPYRPDDKFCTFCGLPRGAVLEAI